MGRPPEASDENIFSTSSGMRAQSTNVTAADGSVARVINIGVPRDHPLADPTSEAGPTGLHNLRIGPVRLPRAPTFVVRIRGPHLGTELQRELNADGTNRIVNIDPRRADNTGDPTPEELELIDHHVNRITLAINSMINTFNHLFSGM